MQHRSATPMQMFLRADVITFSYRMEMILLSVAMQIGNCTDTGCCTSYPPATPLSVSWMWESGLTQNAAPSTGRALAKFTLPSCSYAGCLIVDKRLTRFWISLCDCESNVTQFKSYASPCYRKKKLCHMCTRGPHALRDKLSYSCANNFTSRQLQKCRINLSILQTLETLDLGKLSSYI